MNTTFKYDPEDIESLLTHKQFNELYPEEKEFVLRHVEGEEEYESLRSTLFLMHDSAQNDEWLDPDPSIKRNLMLEFAREEKKGFFIWLNSLFAMPAMPEMVWYRRPAVRYAFATLVLLLGVSSALIFFNKSTTQVDTAAAAVADKTEESNNGIASAADSSNTLFDKPTYAENNQPGVFPPAPAPVLVEFDMEKAEEPQVTSLDDASNFRNDAVAESAPESIDLKEVAVAPAEEFSDKTKIAADEIQVMKSVTKEEEDMVLNEDVQNVVTDSKKTTSTLKDASERLVTDYEQPSSTLPQNTFNNATIVTENNVMTTSGSSGQLSAISNENITGYTWDANALTPSKSASAAAIKDVLDVLFTAN